MHLHRIKFTDRTEIFPSAAKKLASLVCARLSVSADERKKAEAREQRKSERVHDSPQPPRGFRASKSNLQNGQMNSKLFQACVQEIAAFPLSEIITEHDYAASWYTKEDVGKGSVADP